MTANEPLGAIRRVSAVEEGTELFDASAERHILGTQVPKSLNTPLLPKSVVLFVGSRGVKTQPLRRLGGRMNTNDPIIAAIEAHRHACARTRAAFENQSAIENELVAGAGVPAGEAENDPQWVAANAAVGEALAVQDDLAVRLLETQPTTIVGAAALLTYYVDVATTTQPDVVFPEFDGNARPFECKSIDEPRRDFSYFIIRNVAAALSNMVPANKTIERHGASKPSTGGLHRVLVDAAQ